MRKEKKLKLISDSSHDSEQSGIRMVLAHVERHQVVYDLLDDANI